MAHQQNRLHDVWAAGRHLIAREYASVEEPDRAVNEYRALALVEPLDIAPRPVFFDPTVGPVVVYAFVEGTMCDRRVPSATELHTLADVWVRLHSLPPKGLWFARGQAGRHAAVVARLRALPPNERLRRYLARCLAWPSPDPSSSMANLTDVEFFAT